MGASRLLADLVTPGDRQGALQALEAARALMDGWSATGVPNPTTTTPSTRSPNPCP
jgi:hypothetical protein